MIEGDRQAGHNQAMRDTHREEQAHDQDGTGLPTPGAARVPLMTRSSLSPHRGAVEFLLPPPQPDELLRLLRLFERLVSEPRRGIPPKVGEGVGKESRENG